MEVLWEQHGTVALDLDSCPAGGLDLHTLETTHYAAPQRGLNGQA